MRFRIIIYCTHITMATGSIVCYSLHGNIVVLFRAHIGVISVGFLFLV